MIQEGFSMLLSFGYNKTTLQYNLPDENLLGVLLPNETPAALTGEAEVKRALQNPIGTPRLSEIVRPGEKIAIVTSDITRPMPTYAVLPHVAEELALAGVRDEDVTIVFALGIHREMTPEEMRKAAGEEMFSRFACLNASKDYTHLGVSQNGTPVDIFTPVAKADRIICLGNIEYHYFAGYSGGSKAIMPGVSTPSAIQSNHSMMVRESACAGNLEGNPLRRDIEEAAAMCGVDYILNVVLDEHKQIVCAVAGDVTLAHREGCRYLDRLYRKDIDHRADIVIVSQGGAPKDLNLYQTQKALDNAKHAVAKGGVVILVGSCREGLGGTTFQEWMTTMPSPESMVERIGRDFQLGGHKAAAIAMVLQNAEICLVSEMEPDFVRSIFLTPYSDVQSALDYAFQKLGPDASVLVMPYGGSTLPHAMDEQ